MSLEALKNAPSGQEAACRVSRTLLIKTAPFLQGHPSVDRRLAAACQSSDPERLDKALVIRDVILVHQSKAVNTRTVVEGLLNFTCH